jgi:hypothetical protein
MVDGGARRVRWRRLRAKVGESCELRPEKDCRYVARADVTAAEPVGRAGGVCRGAIAGFFGEGQSSEH